MHRVIARTPNSKSTDHRDGNKLNNQSANLRVATHAENGANRGKQVTNTTGFKGVVRHKYGGYIAQLKKDQKQIYIGYFQSPILAAIAYNKAAKKHFEKFALLNLVQ